ncbi:MAG: hypothetical protein ACLP29_08035 [Dissulfurispiraceae bacterium]
MRGNATTTIAVWVPNLRAMSGVSRLPIPNPTTEAVAPAINEAQRISPANHSVMA